MESSSGAPADYLAVVSVPEPRAEQPVAGAPADTHTSTGAPVAPVAAVVHNGDFAAADGGDGGSKLAPAAVAAAASHPADTAQRVPVPTPLPAGARSPGLYGSAALPPYSPTATVTEAHAGPVVAGGSGGRYPESARGAVLAKVPKYLVNGGFDLKYDTSKYPPGLGGAIAADVHEQLLVSMNKVLDDHRTKTVDIVCLGFLCLCYVPCFVYRRKKKAVRRSKSMQPVLEAWNQAHRATQIRVRLEQGSGDLLYEVWP